MDFEEYGDDGAFPLVNVLRDIPIVNVLVEIVDTIEKRDLNFPVRDSVSLFQYVPIVDEQRSPLE